MFLGIDRGQWLVMLVSAGVIWLSFMVLDKYASTTVQSLLPGDRGNGAAPTVDG